MKKRERKVLKVGGKSGDHRIFCPDQASAWNRGGEFFLARRLKNPFVSQSQWSGPPTPDVPQMSGPDALPSPQLQPVKTAVWTVMHFSVVHLKLQLIIGCRVLSVVMSPPWWAKVRHDGSRLVLASFYRGPAPPPAEGGRVQPSVPPPSPWEESATTQIYFVAAATRQRGGRNQWTHFPCQVTNAPDVTRIMGGEEGIWGGQRWNFWFSTCLSWGVGVIWIRFIK